MPLVAALGGRDSSQAYWGKNTKKANISIVWSALPVGCQTDPDIMQIRNNFQSTKTGPLQMKPETDRTQSHAVLIVSWADPEHFSKIRVTAKYHLIRIPTNILHNFSSHSASSKEGANRNIKLSARPSGTVPAITACWHGKTSYCWLHWESRKKERDMGQSCIFICNASSRV